MTDRAAPRAVALHFTALQFAFALGWTVYVVYLPELLARAGVAKSWTPWVLATDQLIFALADLGFGVMMDRARQAMRRVGPWLVALTALSSAAMLALPALSHFGPGLFLAVTFVWVASAAALRAPIFALLGRYATTSEVPALAGVGLVGMGLAAAMAPYLGLQLKGIDPQWPFLLAGGVTFLCSTGLVWAEKRLALGAPAAAEPGTPLPWASPGALLVTLGFFFAVFGVQIQIAFNASAQITRVLDASALPWLLPVFWGGFALGFIPAGRLGESLGAARAGGLAVCLGVGALALGQITDSALGLVVAHALAGMGWAIFMSNGIGLATACGRAGAEGRFTGLFFALLALGTLARIVLGIAGLPKAMPAVLPWLAAAGWALAAACLLLFAARQRSTGQPEAK